jgi:hypothetical protein
LSCDRLQWIFRIRRLADGEHQCVTLAESGLGIAAVDLAQTIVFAIKGFKEIARDGADMRRMIGVQVAIVAAAIGRKG